MATVNKIEAGDITYDVEDTTARNGLAGKVDSTDSRLSNARPASDVYGWAKQPSKPSYSASEISGLGDLATKSTNNSTSNYLRGDGTWATPPNDNTHKSWGLSISGHTVTLVDGGTNKSVTVPDNDHNTTYNSTASNITLAAKSWSSGTYTISSSLITASSNQEVILATTATAAQYKAFSKAMIIGSGQSAGQLTLKALGTVPTVDIPVTVIYRGTI